MRKKYNHLLAICINTYLATACHSIPFFQDEIQPDNVVSTPSIDGMNKKEAELMLAKMWSRVDQLESRVFRQEEKVRLLEKGLMLGVIPEELLPKANPIPTTPTTQNAPEVVKDDQPKRDYNEILTSAQSLFNAGKYGQAIAEYQQLEKYYIQRLEQGQHLYWIGLSWFYLKEDELALTKFDQLIEDYPQSQWLAHAKYYLARTQYRMGFRQKALSNLRSVIQDFPNQEISEMAQFELQRLEKSL